MTRPALHRGPLAPTPGSVSPRHRCGGRDTGPQCPRTGPEAQTLTTGKGWQSRRKSCRRTFLLTSPGNCTSPQNLQGPHTPVSDPGRPTPSLPGAGGDPGSACEDPQASGPSPCREAAQVQHHFLSVGRPDLQCQGIESCSMTRLPDPVPTDLSRRLVQGWAGCGKAPLLHQEHGNIRTNTPNPVLSAAGPASPLPTLISSLNSHCDA